MSGASAPRRTEPAPLRRGDLFWLAGALGLVMAPHALHLPFWMSLVAALVGLWRLWVAQRGLPLPRRSLLLGLTFGSLAGTIASYGSIYGRGGGVALLVLLTALKLGEASTRRDAALLVFLGYFAVITHFLFDQSIPSALYMVLAVIALTATLAGLARDGAPASLAFRVRVSGVLALQALPVMLLLFLFFPRVQGPLWGVPQDAGSGITGLSDTMSPGMLSQLSLSDAVAFRVDFEGAPPPPRRMYWRGPVMTHFDGRTWAGDGPKQYRTPQFQALGEPVDYTVTLEPHNKTWIFALEMASTLPPRSFVAADYQILSYRPLRARTRYAMRSYLDYATDGGEAEWELAAALKLPPELNPRTRAMAREWRERLGSPQQIVAEALAFFRREAFFYTLRPPLLGEHSVDEFLFGTRRGFCEHYASSFAFLMRAAGVPARVVTGYQGGEINPIGNYLIVRQADAHAWTEVWLEGRGWVRVDPTEAVAPNRVERGIASAVPASEPLPALVRSDIEWLRKLRLGLDAVANTWNQVVLGYNRERQSEFLTRVGMRTPSWIDMAMLLFAGTGAILLGFTAYMLWRQRGHERDPVKRAWAKFCRKLARCGLPRAPSEGPMAYVQRLEHNRSDLAPAVQAIGQLYVRLRYGGELSSAAVAELGRRVAEFRP